MGCHAIVINTFLSTAVPVFAQTVKDSTSTTKPNGSGAGNGSSQGSPDAATVSGTGTGTLADSGSSSVGGSATRSVPTQLDPTQFNQQNQQVTGDFSVYLAYWAYLV
jgi:hypothetical protein